MADTNPTIGDLLKAKAVHDEQVGSAVDAVLADPRVGLFEIVDGMRLDLTRIARQTRIAAILRHPDATDGLKRGALRKAILLARPTKG